MEKERDRMNNGSYFFKLNQELSGQPEITPYYAVSDESVNLNEEYETTQDAHLTSSVEEEPVVR